MGKYLLSVHMTSGAAGATRMTPEAMREGYERVPELEREMVDAGAFVLGGRLDQPDKARVVRQSKGRRSVSDGPFAETKEHLGGFYLIEAADLEAATDWADRVSGVIDRPIEVRAMVAESAP